MNLSISYFSCIPLQLTLIEICIKIFKTLERKNGVDVPLGGDVLDAALPPVGRGLLVHLGARRAWPRPIS